MNLQVEFDYEGRTYTVESPSINLWNVHMLAQMNDKMTIETDLRTSGQIFVTWSEIGVIRLVSPVDDNGHAAGPAASQPAAEDGAGAYVHFGNDPGGAAVRNARTFLDACR